MFTPPADGWIVVQSPSDDPSPLVFDSPHSGLDYPADFLPSASKSAVLSTWDAYVDELWGNVPTAGATLVAAKFPRAYIDTNRAASDLDAELLEAPWPGELRSTDYTRRGMGLIRRHALPGVPMYDRKLSVAAVRHRLDNYYWPYRRTLRAQLDAAWQRHGAVWHFNCHSMKSRGNDMNHDSGRGRPDFVISDRDGTTASPATTAWVAKFFSDLGYSVKINDPYRGGDIVGTHGIPADRRTSIQIELNRALYMDEATCQKSANFGALRKDLDRFVVAIRDFAYQAGPGR